MELVFAANLYYTEKHIKKYRGIFMNRMIKIAYIGGGSKLWARTFMSDLAVSEN